MQHEIGTTGNGYKIFDAQSELDAAYYCDQDGNKVQLPRATEALKSSVLAYEQEFGLSYNPKNSSDSSWLETAYQDIPRSEQEWISFKEFEYFFINQLENF